MTSQEAGLWWRAAVRAGATSELTIPALWPIN